MLLYYLPYDFIRKFLINIYTHTYIYEIIRKIIQYVNDHEEVMFKSGIVSNFP